MITNPNQEGQSPISGKTGIGEKLQPVLERHRDKVAFAYLFGSTLSHQGRPLSDIDIAVYTSNKKKSNFLEIKFALYADFCRALNRNDIDVVLLNTAKNIILLENIVNEGLVIFETPRGEITRRDFELKVRHMAASRHSGESRGSGVYRMV
jgi:predicted nucleotidyltransferase